MKIALVTDTHWGVRADQQLFHDYFKKFYSEIFFPYIDKHKISTVIHLGDMVDRRKYINFNTANRLKEDFLNPLAQRNLDCHFIVGNHDSFYKNTIKLNAHRELIWNKYPFEIYDDPTEKMFGDTNILLVPWICDENRQQTIDLIGSTNAQICMGHLELSGYEMYKGSIISNGDDPSLFDRFDIVCSGHYHHRSTDGHIFYLGSHAEFTWSDYEDSRGFNVFDTETRDLTFVQNPFTMFKKIWYDDSEKKLEDLIDQDFSGFSEKFIKVIVTNKTNPYFFDQFISKIEKSSPYNLQIVEDHLNGLFEDDEHIVDEAESTIDIFNGYIDSLNVSESKEKLKTMMLDLYMTSLNTE